MKNILEEITLTDVLIIYLLYDIFLQKPYYILDEEDVSSKPFELEEGKEKNIKKNKRFGFFNKKNIDVESAHSKIKKIDNYLYTADNIKRKTINLKNAKKEEQKKLIMKEIKHRLGDTYKKAENIMNFVPLLSSMFSSRESSKSDTEDKNIKKLSENMESKNDEESNTDDEYNQIYELVELLS